MPNPNDNRKWLYDKLTEKGVKMGTYEQFDKAIDDENNLKWVYDKANSKGLKVGDYGQFTGAMKRVAAEAPATAEKPATETVQPDVTASQTAPETPATEKTEEKPATRPSEPPKKPTRTDAYKVPEINTPFTQPEQPDVPVPFAPEAPVNSTEVKNTDEKAAAELREQTERDVKRYGTGNADYTFEEAVSAGKGFEKIAPEIAKYDERLKAFEDKYGEMEEAIKQVNEGKRSLTPDERKRYQAAYPEYEKEASALSELAKEYDSVMKTAPGREYKAISDRMNEIGNGPKSAEAMWEYAQEFSKLQRNPLYRAQLGDNAPSEDEIQSDLLQAQAAYIEAKLETLRDSASGPSAAMLAGNAGTNEGRRKQERELKKALSDVKEALYANQYYRKYVNQKRDYNKAQSENISVIRADYAERLKAGQSEEGYDPNAGFYSSEIGLLDAAASMHEDAIREYEKPTKYDETSGWVNAAKGLGDWVTDDDTWTFGLKSFINDIGTVRPVLEKVEKIAGNVNKDDIITNGKLDELEKQLTPGELAVLDAYFEKVGAVAMKGADTSIGYQIGQGIGDMVNLGIEMALTGGVGTAVREGVDKAGMAMMKKLMEKRLYRKFAKTGIGRVALWSGHKAVRDVAETLVRIPFMPSTYKAIGEGAVELSSDYKTRDFWEYAPAKSFENFVEQLTEVSNGFAFPLIGKVMKMRGMKNFVTAALGENSARALRSFMERGEIKLLDDAMIGSFGGEWEEELLGAVIHSVTDDPNALRDFFSAEQQLVLLGTLAPIPIARGASGSIQLAVPAARAALAWNKAEGELKRLGFDDGRIARLKEVVDNASAPEGARAVMQALKDAGVSRQTSEGQGFLSAAGAPENDVLYGSVPAMDRDAYDALAHYYWAAQQKRAAGLMGEVEQDRKVRDKRAELKSRYGQFWHNAMGEEVVETGTIIGADGRPLNVFIASDEPMEDGKVAYVGEDGSTGFLSRDQLVGQNADGTFAANPETTVTPINIYLAGLVMQDSQVQEAQGVANEVENANMTLRQQVENLENIKYKGQSGTITRADDNGAVFVPDDGENVRVSWSELAAENGIQEPDVKTPAEMTVDGAVTVAGHIQRQEALAAEYRQAAEEAGKAGRGALMDTDEGTASVVNIISDTIDPENGTAQFTVRMPDGRMEVTMATAIGPVMSQLRGEAAPEPAPEPAPAPAPAPGPQPTAGGNAAAEKDFRGNPIPTRDGKVDEEAFREADPEAWAAWNDALPEDDPRKATLGTKKRLEGLAKSSKSAADKAQKELEKLYDKGATDKEIRDKETEVRDQRARQKRYEDAIASINKRDLDKAEAEREAARKAAEAERLRREKEKEEEEKRKAGKAPDISEDTPEAAQKRGYIMVNGNRIDRATPDAVAEKGKDTKIAFTKSVAVDGKYGLVEATRVEPSHISDQENPLHFFAKKWQPKNRKRADSAVAIQQMANGIRPGEITRGETAYGGAPIVNERGEVIQGNGRSEALRRAYGQGTAAEYKAWLADHAEEFGFTREQVEKMETPILVRVLDVDDARAEQLGKMEQKDLESGGDQRFNGKTLVKKMGKRFGEFLDYLFAGDLGDDATALDYINQNGYTALHWLHQNGFINDTEYANAQENGKLTEETVSAFRAMSIEPLFDNVPEKVRSGFEMLPNSVKLALQRSVATLYGLDGVIGDIQDALAYYCDFETSDPAFKKAKNTEEAWNAVTAWMQNVRFDGTSEGEAHPSIVARRLASVFKGGVLVDGEKNPKRTEKAYRSLFTNIANTMRGEGGFMSAAEPTDNIGAYRDNNVITGDEENQIRNGKNDNRPGPASGPGANGPVEGQGSGPVREGRPGGVSERKPAGEGAGPVAPEAPANPAPETPAGFGANNKLFTKDARDKAREIMLRKLKGQLNAGIDPEMLTAMIQYCGYYIEAGVRTFVEFAKTAIKDLGDAIRPYLKSMYTAVRHYPGMEEYAKEMTPYDEVEKVDVDAIGKEEESAEEPVEEPAEEPAEEPKQVEPKYNKGDTVTFWNPERTMRITGKIVGVKVTKDFGTLYDVESVLRTENPPGRKEPFNYVPHTYEGVMEGYIVAREKAAEPAPAPEEKPAEAQKPTTKDGWLKKMGDVYKELCNKFKVPEDPIAQAGIRRYSFDYSATKGYTLDALEKYYEEYRKKLDDAVEPATEKQLAYIDRLADEQDKEILKGVTLNKVSAGYVISILKAAEDAISSRMSTVQEFEEYENELRRVAELNGKTVNKSENPSESPEKSVTSQEENLEQGSLFGEPEPAPEEKTPVKVETKKEQGNGLQGNDGAVLPEGLPTDGSGPEGRNQEGQGNTGEGERREAGGTDGGGQRDRAGDVRIMRPRPDDSVKKNTRNNRVSRGETVYPKTPAARFKANMAAIRLLKQIEQEGREATKEEMDVLRKFTGWGGLGSFFNNRYSNEYREISAVLTTDEIQAAENSINTAYYTPVEVIDAMWDIAKKLGFKGGSVLEGSAGIGNILASMPEAISNRSDIQAVELDPITGGVLRLLYPDANVLIDGFENADIPNNSVDLAITNVPFGDDIRVYDEKEKDLTRKFGGRIHDFCIAKNIRKLREGGIAIFITSRSTLDSTSKTLRNWIVNEGGSDVIGVFRLNNDTFEGTGATSDIIVVRKRVNGEVSPDAINIQDTSVVRRETYEASDRNNETTETRVAMEINDYFAEHPENMGGEMAFGFEKGDTYRPGSSALWPAEGVSQSERLEKWVSGFRQQVQIAKRETTEEPERSTAKKEGQIVLDSKGRPCISRMGKAVPIDVDDRKVGGYTKAQLVRDYDAIKTALDDVLRYQLNNASDEGLAPLLRKLNSAYDTFVSRYGYLNKNRSLKFLRNDVDFPSIAALEKYSERKGIDGKVTVKVQKTPVFSGRVLGQKATPTPKDVRDGVIVSMTQYGRVDIPFIAKALGRDEESVRKEALQSGLCFENPENGTVEVEYEYLSGNVREKLAYAESHNEDGKYDANIKALKKVIPPDIPAHLIEFSLGSDWLPVSLYTEYAKEKFGVNNDFVPQHFGGSWGVSASYYGQGNDKNISGGVRSTKLGITKTGVDLMLAAMNKQTVKFSITIKEDDGTKRTETDKEASQAAATKIDEMRDDFKEWCRKRMLNDTELSESISRTYNDTFNAIAPKKISDIFSPEHFDGQVESMGGKPFHLYPHQSKAVVRATTQPLMMAHEVGTGKTFTLITTAMEMRRLGTAKKPMIVVQNSTLGQFVSSAKALYPNAKILTLSERDRTKEGRAEFYAKIKYNDWDMIIIPQSVFDMIPDSEKRKRDYIEAKIDEARHILQQAIAAKNSAAQKRLEEEIKDLEYERDFGEKRPKKKSNRDAKREAKAQNNAKARAQQQLDRKTDDVSDFDDMGVDALLIDEAHNYKRLGFSTSMAQGVKGVDPAYSKKSAGVYLKTRAIFDKAGWKNVVFATGTPISNTAAEIWTFMRYMMPDEMMRELHIYYFDDFVSNFGNISQSLEFTTSGKFKENNRFASYTNLPELIRIWSSVTDTVLTKDAVAAKADAGEEVEKLDDKVPVMENWTDDEGNVHENQARDIYLPQSPSLIRIMNAVRARLEWFEGLTGKEKRQNSSVPLVMYGLAKMAAIDPRLVDRNAADEPQSKTNRVVEEVLLALKDSEKYKGTCALFSDNFRRMERSEGREYEAFNLFNEIKRKLVAAGVPEDQIVIIKSGMSVQAKEKIFAAVNAGEIRVIMGTTASLGTGVNIQERLFFEAHLDAPNRPMDYTQRMGRILRQGNLHKQWGIPVRVVRFGVEDSLDVTAYQRLSTKSKFINSIMDGRPLIENGMENRVLEEEEEGIFDNPVAVLSGSQYAMLKSAAERELRKLRGKKEQHLQDQIYIESTLNYNKSAIKNLNDRIKESEKWLSVIQEKFPDGKIDEIVIEGKKVTTDEEIAAALKEKIFEPLKAAAEQRRKYAEANTYERSREEYKEFTIKVNGVLVRVLAHIKPEEDWRTRKVSISTTVRYQARELGIDEFSARKMPNGINGVKDIINDFLENVASGALQEENLESYHARIAKLEADNENMMARRGKPFADEDKLAEQEKRVEELTQKMKEEMAEKEAKYAAQASGIDGSSFDLDAAAENMEDNEEEDSEEGDLYRTSDEIAEEYPNWMDDQTSTEVEGSQRGQNTQVAGTVGTYRKVGDWIESNLGKETKVLDASSGLGLGTLELRERGFDVEDIEPYPGKGRREQPTYGGEDAYQQAVDDGKEYDFIISNAVLNVIPDDWRAGVLHNMARLLKPGGRMFINTRKAGEERTIKNKIELDSPQEVLVGTPERINSYQRFFTPAELKEYVERELGDGYTVEIANKRNSGTSGLAAVVVTKKTEGERNRRGENLRNPIERAAAIVKINEIAAKLGVKFEEDPDLKAKGVFSPKTGKIRINIDAHRDTADLEATLLHEAVAHYGLRKLFGKDWKELRMRLYEQASPEIKARVDAIAKADGLSTEVAMEEYIAQLAEDGRFDQQEESFWQKIVTALKRLLAKIGFNSGYLTDEDFRAMLYASYRNLQTGGALETAARVATAAALRRNAEASHEDNGPEDDGPGGGLPADTEEDLMDRESDATAEKRAIKERAIADGSFMKAPNGQPTNLTEDQWLTVRTQAFKDWFGDWENDPANASKVVDENGEPLVVYRVERWEGDNADYTVFDENKGGNWRGFYFTNRDAALKNYGDESTLRAFFLDSRNPYTEKNFNVLQGDKRELIDMGHDGMIFAPDGINARNFEVKVFEPNQIKSATDNNGNFSTEDPDIYHRFLGEEGARNLDASEETRIRQDNLEVAKEMEKAGKKAIKIKQATGWERGADGKWRYEVPDNIKVKDDFFNKVAEDVEFNRHNDAYANRERMDADPEASARWKELMSDYRANKDEIEKMMDEWGLRQREAEYNFSDIFDAPELLKAYPQLKNLKIRAYNMSGAWGRSWGGVIDLYDGFFNPESRNYGYRTVLGVLVHELQHEIQRIEGFERGQSGGYDYHERAGEVEARNVTDRINMGTSARARTLAEETEDVPRSEQVFKTTKRDSEGMADMEIDQDSEEYYRRDRGYSEAKTADDMYDRKTSTVSSALYTAQVDEYAPLDAFQQAISAEAKKELSENERVSNRLRELGGQAMNEVRTYNAKFLQPMWKAIAELRKAVRGADGKKLSMQELTRYVGLKSGLERNELFAKRDAKKDAKSYYDKEYEKRKAELSTRENEEKARLKARLDEGIISDVTYQGELNALAIRIQQLKDKADADHQANIDNVDKETASEYRRLYGEYRQKDYSGLLSWFTEESDLKRSDYPSRKAYQRAVNAARKNYIPGVTDLASAEAMAKQIVDDIESRAGSQIIDNLWNRINAATKETLDFQYRKNMISRQQKADISASMQYYIPMRGFEDATAEDLYSYYMKPNVSGFAPTILAAKGRGTRYRSPFGMIGFMHSSAVSQGLKNEAKLELLDFVRRNPKNTVATVTRAWFVKTGETDADGKPIYEVAYPQVPEGATIDERERIIEDFETDMKERKEKGEAYNAHREVQMNGGVVAFEKDAHRTEHIVRVMEGGREYGIVINGNPAAAQAVNGIKRQGGYENFLEILRATRRVLSQMFTTLSVPFWVSNFQRDHGQGGINTFVRNNLGYVGKYIINRWELLPQMIPLVLSRAEQGSFMDRLSPKFADYYRLYLENGGPMGQNRIETGVTFNRQLERYLRTQQNDKAFIAKGAAALAQLLGAIGEGVETITRFATFVTSMEYGRSVHEAIADSKEVSTNFARKGHGRSISWEETGRMETRSGRQLGDTSGNTFETYRNYVDRALIVSASAVLELLRAGIPFFNAAIQGIKNKTDNYRKNWIKALLADGTYFAIGFAMRYLLGGAGGDDDKEKYGHTSDYTRRNNFLMPLDPLAEDGRYGGMYHKWALSQEYRYMYALGDITAEALLHEKPYDDLALDAFEALVQVLPAGAVDPSARGEAFWIDAIKSVLPGVVVPVVEAFENKDFKGSRIYDEGFNGNKVDDPEWTKAIDTTGPGYVKTFEWLNKVTGGNEENAAVRGSINLNPAIIEHFVKSYLSGPYQVIGGVGTIVGKKVRGDEIAIRDIPVWNRLFMNTNDNSRDAYYSGLYYYFKDLDKEARRLDTAMNGHETQQAKDFRQSKDYAYMLIFKKYESNDRALNKMKKAAQNAGDDEAVKNVELMKTDIRENIAKECLDIYFDRVDWKSWLMEPNSGNEN